MIERVSKRFTDYVNRFKGRGPDHDFIIRLKEAHSHRVRRETRHLAEDLSLSREDREIADLAALLHDTGRFPQYAIHGTFEDSRSEDHAVLGVRVIVEEGLLEGADDRTEALVLSAIRRHNLPRLPAGGDPGDLLLSRILRDADKLDIWRIILADHEKRGGKGCAPVEPQLPRGGDLSDTVHRELISGKPVRFTSVESLIDKEVFRAGWVLDLNFIPSLERARERRYLERIHAVLPSTPKIDDAFSRLHSLVRERIEGTRAV